MERFVEVAPDTRLWVGEHGDPTRPPLLLIMGANASALAWPDALIERLAAHHRVIRYDHRDTGRSTRAFDERPYVLAELAEDAIAILDALGIERAHLVGMSLGGILVQLLLLDHPERLLSATMFSTAALGTGLAASDNDPEAPELPGPDPRLLEFWATFGEPHTLEEELAWRIEHWRLLNGDSIPFDAAEFRRREEAEIAHSGTHASSTAHAQADQSGLERGRELRNVRTPVLVIEAPEDPVYPPPHAEHLASIIPGARLVRIPGMGHALPAPVLPPLADAILAHTAR